MNVVVEHRVIISKLKVMYCMIYIGIPIIEMVQLHVNLSLNIFIHLINITQFMKFCIVGFRNQLNMAYTN
jgi:hypothetical protein